MPEQLTNKERFERLEDLQDRMQLELEDIQASVNMLKECLSLKPEPTYKCLHCGKAFTNEAKMYRHEHGCAGKEPKPTGPGGREMRGRNHRESGAKCCLSCRFKICVVSGSDEWLRCNISGVFGPKGTMLYDHDEDLDEQHCVSFVDLCDDFKNERAARQGREPAAR